MSDTTNEIPEGWQLVPVKPTMEMIKNAAGDHEGENWLPHSLWASMLAAAPSAPAVWQPDAGAQWYLERIREEISAGRKQNALAYLSFAFAEFSSRQDELRRLGAQMSNVLFNLAQTAVLSVSNREMMKELTRQWDAAVGAALKETEGRP